MSKIDKDKKYWCSYTGHVPAKKDGKRPKHVRCPICRRRLIPQTVNGEPQAPNGWGEDFQAEYQIPYHKIPHGKRRN
jgi:hypothetical protein